MSSGTSKNPAQRAIKRIAPKLLELVIVSLPIARTFCGRLLDQYLKTMSYFDPAKGLAETHRRLRVHGSCMGGASLSGRHTQPS